MVAVPGGYCDTGVMEGESCPNSCIGSCAHEGGSAGVGGCTRSSSCMGDVGEPRIGAIGEAQNELGGGADGCGAQIGDTSARRSSMSS